MDGFTYPPEMLPSPDEGDEVEIVVDGEALTIEQAMAELERMGSVSLDEMKIELGLETVH